MTYHLDLKANVNYLQMILVYFLLFTMLLFPKVIYDWIHQWKVKLNPDLRKQAQEIIFSRRVSKSFCPDVHFENNPVNFLSISLQTC